MPADGLTTGYANQHLRRPLIFIELPSERLLSDVTTLLTATQLQQSRESDCYSVVPARDLLRSPPSEFFELEWGWCLLPKLRARARPRAWVGQKVRASSAHMLEDDARRQGLRLAQPDYVDGSEGAALGAESAPLAELCHVSGDSSEAPAAHAASRLDSLEVADAEQVQRVTDGDAPPRSTRPARVYRIL